MRLFARYYNKMFIQNLGDDQVLRRLSGMCKPGDEFLDLCCGSGRVLTFPLKQDVKAVGIDNNPEMLVEARNYLQGLGLSNYELVEADALDLDYDRRFKVVTCASHCISFFKGEAVLQALFERVYKSMVTGGTFFIEAYVPGEPEDGFHRVRKHEVDGGELTCTLRVSSEVDDSDGSITKVFTYDLEMDGTKEREVYKVGEVHLQPVLEIAIRVGFTVEGVYGDSNATVPLDSTSITQSVLLKKV